MTVPILNATRHWYCPNGCGQTDVTTEARPHSRLHQCPRLRGIIAPFVEVGVKAKVEAKEREDYIGTHQLVRMQGGRPIEQVITTRDEGQDTVVFAPTAVVRIT